MEICLCSLDHSFLTENMGNSGFFANGKETSRRKAEIETNLRTGIKLYQQSSNINSVVLSSSTDFEGLKRLMAFTSCESQPEPQN
jgi:hypothetical protein